MKTITVLMSTYNGSKYLREQIESVLAQTNVNVRLIVRDDGSKDNTLNILEEYAQSRKLQWYNGENLKPLGSFMHLLFNCPESSYYAFCDQDDVWLHDKLSKSLKKMEDVELCNPNKPIIIHTDMTVVDSELNVISKSFWDNNGIRPDILNKFEMLACYNGVNGCTILMNNTARKLIKERYFHQSVFIHDVMSSLIVSANGGIIDYVDEPTLLYRQHEGNVVGADHIQKYYYFQRFKNIFFVIHHNIENFKMVNNIGKISLPKYIYDKILYIFTKKHGIR